MNKKEKTYFIGYAIGIFNGALLGNNWQSYLIGLTLFLGGWWFINKFLTNTTNNE